MLRRQNILLFRHRNMRIDFRNIDRTMSKHLLNIPDIHIRLKQAGGKSMPEHMRGNMQINRSKRSIFLNHISYRLFGKTLIQPIDEKISAVLYLRTSTTSSFPICIFRSFEPFPKIRTVRSYRSISDGFKLHSSEMRIPVEKSSSITAMSRSTYIF